MSYQAQAALEADYWFQQRERAAAIQQAGQTPPDAELDQAALAAGLMRDDGALWMAFVRVIAAFPGLADGATGPNGEVDSSLITDGDLLAQTQAAFPTVAALYFDDMGNPV